MTEKTIRTIGEVYENDTVLAGLDHGLLMDAIKLKEHERWRQYFPLGPIRKPGADRTHLNEGTAGTVRRP